MNEEDAHLCVGPGWAPLIRAFYGMVRVNPHLFEDVQVQQVKEKFGELRIYFIQGNDWLLGYTAGLTVASRLICEYCGQAGFVRPDLGWLKTFCDMCYADYKTQVR